MAWVRVGRIVLAIFAVAAFLSSGVFAFFGILLISIAQNFVVPMIILGWLLIGTAIASAVGGIGLLIAAFKGGLSPMHMTASAPAEQEIRLKLSGLISGICTRKEAQEWAGQWIYADNPPDMPAHLWEALSRLAGSDLKNGGSGAYLDSEMQFQDWLREFDHVCVRG